MRADHRRDSKAKGLPDEFPPAEKCYSLYEGIPYQEYWEDPKLARLDALERHLISDMLPASGRRIIDLGCGYGRLAPCYLDRFDQVVLCDGSLSLLRDAHASLGNRAFLVAADIAHLPFRAASFDCTLAIRVLHHVVDLQRAFVEIHRVVAGDGRFIFSYHNKRNARRMLRYFAAQGAVNPFSPEPVELTPTLISHHPSEFETLMQGAGFSAPDYQGAAVLYLPSVITHRFGRRTPGGVRLAPFMGKFRLAPWLIGTSFAEGGYDLQGGSLIDDILQCPACNGNLGRSGTGFACSACHRNYPFHEGIADFRL